MFIVSIVCGLANAAVAAVTAVASTNLGQTRWSSDPPCIFPN